MYVGIIESVLNGVNCSVFAYGATGAGKTYTMLGSQEKPGIMFLTMMELYRKIYEKQDEISCDVAVSYLEVSQLQMRRDMGFVLQLYQQEVSHADSLCSLQHVVLLQYIVVVSSCHVHTYVVSWSFGRYTSYVECNMSHRQQPHEPLLFSTLS